VKFQDVAKINQPLALLNVAAPRGIFAGVVALPPVEIVQVRAEDELSAFDGGDRNAVADWAAAFGANAGVDELGRDGPVPGNAAIVFVIDSGAVDRAERSGRARVPVLAVGPVVVQDGNATNVAERELGFIRLEIAPKPAVAAIETTRAAVVGAAVGHGFPSYLSAKAL